MRLPALNSTLSHSKPLEELVQGRSAFVASLAMWDRVKLSELVVLRTAMYINRQEARGKVIGASLSEPHTSGTALRKCVNIRACLRPYISSILNERIHPNISQSSISPARSRAHEGYCPSAASATRSEVKHAWQLLLLTINSRPLTGGTNIVSQARLWLSCGVRVWPARLVQIRTVVEVASGRASHACHEWNQKSSS